MNRLDNNTLYNVEGGAINASLISAIVRAFNTIIDFGVKIGSSLRRKKTKNYC